MEAFSRQTNMADTSFSRVHVWWRLAPGGLAALNLLSLGFTTTPWLVILLILQKCRITSSTCFQFFSVNLLPYQTAIFNFNYSCKTMLMDSSLRGTITFLEGPRHLRPDNHWVTLRVLNRAYAQLENCQQCSLCQGFMDLDIRRRFFSKRNTTLNSIWETRNAVTYCIQA